MEPIENLGVPISRKTITIEQLPNGNGRIIIGTPKLTFEELNELIGVCNHQIEFNAKQRAKGAAS